MELPPFPEISDDLLHAIAERHGVGGAAIRRLPEVGIFNAIYALGSDSARAADTDSTGDLLVEMSLWTFGLPYAEALPDGDVLVAYYAGDAAALDIRWVRLRAV